MANAGLGDGDGNGEAMAMLRSLCVGSGIEINALSISTRFIVFVGLRGSVYPVTLYGSHLVR